MPAQTPTDVPTLRAAEATETTIAAPKSEAPLTPAKRTFVALGIASVLFFAYLFSALSLLLVLLLVVIDAVLVIPGLRIGMAGYFASAAMRQGILAGLLFKSLRLEESPDLNILLDRTEAPRLFEMLEELAKEIHVPPPAEVRLMMPMNAWVRVRGYRSGRKGSIVCIGFDILAACTEDELRAILAHELAHAKLIQPGFNGWLTNAIRRLGQLAMAVGGLEQSAREQDEKFYTAAAISRGLGFFGRAGSKLVALHSRQHEFLADAVAARVAGIGPFRSGLMRVHVVEQAIGDLDHRERLIQSQREESFAQWLQSKMVVQPEDQQRFAAKALKGENRDPLDSHPALADRLSAMPEPESTLSDSEPATQLLRAPDRTAARLLGEIERVISEAEKKENQELLTAVRKKTPRPSITGLQALIISVQLVLFVFLLLFVIFLISDFSLSNLGAGLLICGFILACMVGAAALYRLCKRKEKAFLPSPAYALLAPRLDKGPFCKDSRSAVEWRNAALAQHPAHSAPIAGGRRAIAEWWGDRCFEAIGICDYPRAFACATHCLANDYNQLKGLAALPVVEAAIGDDAAAGHALERLFKRYSLGPSASWSVGWCFALQAEWATAEAYLHDAASRRTADPSVWALLGYCQWQREKIRESVNSLRRAIYLRPDDPAQRLLLARILLDAGRPKEVEQMLRELDLAASTSQEGLLMQVRLNLLLGRPEKASKLAEALTSRFPTGKVWLDVGRAYHEAKDLESAENALRHAREMGFYPEALVGLAVVLHEKKSEEWKSVLLEAIDTSRAPEPDAISPQLMLKVVCRILTSFREPAKCSAWSAHLHVAGLGFEGSLLRLILAAETSEAAAAQLQEIWSGLHGAKPAPPPTVTWQLLPKENQPDSPIPPGIYDVQLTQGFLGPFGRLQIPAT